MRKLHWISLAALAVLCAAPVPASAVGVVTYHNSLTRHGDYRVPALTLAAAANVHRDTAFNAGFSGNVYAQPLYWRPEGVRQGIVIVATESNTVYALNDTTGAIVWQQTGLPPSVPLAQLPCGNIDPMGITGTPVIDPATATLYLNALTDNSGTIKHMVYALSLADGSVKPGWPVDMQTTLAGMGASFDSPHQGSRGALLFFGGRLYVSYGGNGGDCLPYHGTVVQVAPATATVEAYWQTRGARGGIWAQGGIAGDGQALYVTTGNTSGTTDWADGEGIIRLVPGLAHSTRARDFFTPANWQDLDAHDKDLGGTEALPFDIPLSGGGMAPRVIALGKDGNAYLADRRHLGGIGGALAVTPVANGPIRTAPAILEMTDSALVAFQSNGSTRCSDANITMLSVAPSGVSPITVPWCTRFSGRGSPIITTTDGHANAIVWVVGAEGDGLLHGYDAQTGASVFTDTAAAMAGTHHFETILATERRFYIAADNTVYAYDLVP
jgi:outer membrane protein assembly factor BamB